MATFRASWPYTAPDQPPSEIKTVAEFRQMLERRRKARETSERVLSLMPETISPLDNPFVNVDIGVQDAKVVGDNGGSQ